MKTAPDGNISLKILIADDHEIVRKGLLATIRKRGWEVCAEANDGRQAVKLAITLKPDIVLLDLGMSGLNGLEATRQIRKELPSTKVIILTMHESEEMAGKALRAGALGYVVKNDPSEQLIAAIEAVSHQKLFLSPKVSKSVLQGYLRGWADALSDGSPDNTFTAREREVLQLLAEGKSNKEAAAELEISVMTLETHRKNIMRKGRFRSISDIIHFAIRNGILIP